MELEVTSDSKGREKTNKNSNFCFIFSEFHLTKINMSCRYSPFYVRISSLFTVTDYVPESTL